jgi:Tfp pilus assembly protein PilO
MRASARIWTLGGVAVCALAMLIAWVAVVSPKQAKAGAKWTEADAASAQADALRARTASLEKQFAEIDTRRAELATKREALPGQNALEDLLRTLNEAAAATGVRVEDVIPTEPIDLTEELHPAPPSVSTTDESSSESSSSEAPASTGASAAGPAASAFPVYALPVTVRVSGTLADVEAFLRVAQTQQPRAMLFTSMSIVPQVGSTTFNEYVVLSAETRVFVSPDQSVAVANPAAGTDAAGGTS